MSTDEPIIYQLKVTLRRSRPAIWRRFLVYGDISFYDLHDVLQTVMGWEDAHAFQFIIDDKTLMADDMVAETDDAIGAIDADTVALDELLTEDGMKFIYEYDFGDAWEHEIEVEARLPFDPDATYPTCLDGARACPPEDSGGVYGYRELLEVLADPSHEDHEEMSDWVGDDFDPEEFSIEEINEFLAEEWEETDIG